MEIQIWDILNYHSEMHSRNFAIVPYLTATLCSKNCLNDY